MASKDGKEIILKLNQAIKDNKPTETLVEKASSVLLSVISEDLLYSLPSKTFLKVVNGFKGDFSMDDINLMRKNINKFYSEKVLRNFEGIQNISQTLAFVPMGPKNACEECNVTAEDIIDAILFGAEEEDFIEEEDFSEEIIEDNEVPEGILRSVWVGDIDRVKEIVAKDPKQVNEVFDRIGNTLHCAIYNERPEIVEFLLKSGVDVLAVGALNQTALHYAAYGDMCNIFNKIVETKGVNLDAKDDDGETALIIAVKHNKTEYVKELIKRGANVNIQDNTKSAAIHYAADLKETEIVRMLLDANADYNLMDENMQTPFLISCQNGGSEIASMISKKFSQANEIIVDYFSDDSDE